MLSSQELRMTSADPEDIQFSWREDATRKSLGNKDVYQTASQGACNEHCDRNRVDCSSSTREPKLSEICPTRSYQASEMRFVFSHHCVGGSIRYACHRSPPEEHMMSPSSLVQACALDPLAIPKLHIL